ncbi:MAG TPA: MCE family protein [Marmoricola sp.]|nr:MCE family protein [Marmoricola sp.]
MSESMNAVVAWLGERRRLVAVVLVACLVAGGYYLYRSATGPIGYEAQLHNAAGLQAGDEVRIAGIQVGKVSSIAARGAVVEVDFNVNRDVTLTTDTRTEVKLGSLLGQRYLQLDLGSGPTLPHGGTLTLADANDSYTLEQFWLDASPVIGELNLPTLTQAIKVLQQSTSSSSSTQAALEGLTSVANLINDRSTQLTQLVTSTRAVTDQVVAQKGQIASLLTNGSRVFSLIAQRRNAIARLLADGRSLVTTLTSMAKTNSVPMRTAMVKLNQILGVLDLEKANLTKTLQLANPAMRLYVNSAGDGPWIGVNAPGLILPDSYWCLQLKLACK